MKTTTFHISGMCCAAEQTVIEKKLQSLPNIQRYTFNLIAQKLTVEFSGEESKIIQELRAIGFDARIQETKDNRSWWEKNNFIVFTCSSLLFLLSGFLAQLVISKSSSTIIILFSAAIVLG